MLWTLFVVLVVLWALGLLTHTLGGLVHVLLIAAAVVLVVNLIQRRTAA